MSGKPWRLTQRAARSLREIAVWTRSTFGKRQSDAYRKDLVERLNKNSEGRLVGRSCRSLVQTDLDIDLRYVRSGRHYVIFAERDAEIAILDFLHVQSDLPRHLAASQSRADDG